ncbi:type I polyketide synthase [Nocardioides cavernaquae]|uniref:type I polyketide synthase n=1 Tax=Nocardioides cavernaquae TaxID=2321396 RepID=UPI001EE60A55|nr:type I polyketide synthase [Nocardioides cavernaquae]
MTPDTALATTAIDTASGSSTTSVNGASNGASNGLPDHTGKRLLDRLAAGTPFAVAFGGQGADWLEPLAELVRVHRLELGPIVTAAEARLAPVAAELLRADADFRPVAWLDAVVESHSAEVEDAPEIPSRERLLSPSRSLPGITLSHLGALHALRDMGLDPRGAVAKIGHSQGCLPISVIDGADEADVLALSRLIGAAAEVVGVRRGLLGECLVAVPLPHAEVQEAIDGLPASSRLVAAIVNGPSSTVVSGPVVGQERLRQALGDDVTVDPVLARAAYHHPEFAEAVDLTVEWAVRCGLDADWARDLAHRSLVEPIDWPAQVETVADAGARWLLDLGPVNLASQISAGTARAHGIGIVAPTTPRGLRELTVAGAAPRRTAAWTSFAPEVVALPDGTRRVETRFTRLTGRSPIILAGMTPTTVDPAIVAAAANAGFWAELAGGGQVTEEIFAENLERLGSMLEPGRTAAFNALLLDPYLWKLQLGGNRLVQKARAAGAAIDAVIVTAGVPEIEDAVALIHELREGGIEYVVFKPGTVAQIKKVLAIADEVAPVPVIIQVEGGKAGGHHSWEDLDALLLTTYADLRRRANVVVCVGGGIGTPESAASYVTGSWSIGHGRPAMPLDGILVGTAAMATLEATTSPAVKQLLVDTPGTPIWLEDGAVDGGMTSGRSQLGASIHEVENTSAKVGRILDEVAGDAKAVAARRHEIAELLDLTAKPYFGDVATMSYGTWLARYLELSAPVSAAGPEWLDVTIRDRFHALVQRAEARLADADNGPIATLFPTSADVEDGAAALDALRAAYPALDEVQLHPADVPFFVTVCRRAGKPVPFVPVIDADVRRWWRADSLWQSHDPRFPADAVSVIPGPVAVAGITRVDEPVADLLRRFEAGILEAVVDTIDGAPAAVAGLRRAPDTTGAVSLVLAAPDAVWAGRTVINPVRRLGDDWLVVHPARAEHPATGSVLTGEGDVAVLEVPVGATVLRFRIAAGADVAAGAAPVVLNPASEMTALLELAAGGPSAGVARWEPTTGAEHAAATAAGGPATAVVPDALVGLVWPSVFGALAQRPDVVEGMLDLVHLDHALIGSVPVDATDLDVDVQIRSVVDTEVGRVVTVDVDVATGSGEPVATLVERFAIRGRTGAVALADPERAGGAVTDERKAERRRRAHATVTAPSDLRTFASVTGDHNPIHTSTAAAALAGLGGPIVHGMWISAVSQRVVMEQTGRALTGWTARFLAPVRPGASVEITAHRVGIDAGVEVVEVSARVDGDLVLLATARLAAARTAYVFPGQGIQHAGMGMEGYRRSKAAKAIWDRADDHTRKVLGFSVLEVVRDNPTELVAFDGVHSHPDGVLFLTQFTQVGMAVLAAAQMAELVEAGVAVDDAIIAGHSVGEYNALAAVSGVLSLEAVVEVVFQRGSVMHTLVPRDEKGRSNYRLAAIRPAQFGVADADVRAFVEGVAAESGEFLEIANYNLRGSQYAIAGTVAGLEVLEEEIERRRAAVGGKASYIVVPGVDVPFHSGVLRGGVDDFRAKLGELLPPTVDPSPLLGRYVPNLVARPFALDKPFLESILEVAPAVRIEEALANWATWSQRPEELCRLVLIELLAWQFASPVRWIETQDLFVADAADGGLGVERIIEVGVGRAPTVANLASATLKLPEVRRTLAGPVEVLNVERDALVVFARDEDPVDLPETDEASPDVPASAATVPGGSPSLVPATPAPAASGGPRPADIPFVGADATRLLLAWWTKVRPDQLGDADSIESLTDGASSRRNQLLVDLGAELSLGAIDGAAEADLPTLCAQVNGLSRGYRPLGPVLSAATGDHLRKVLGPLGARQSAIADRVTGAWQLGEGWALHTLVEVAAGTREGASVRGGDLATLTVPGSAAELDGLIDAAVAAVAARQGVSVSLPSAGGGGEVTLDAAALAGVTGGITSALASTARHLLAQLGEDAPAAAVAEDTAEARAALDRIEVELGSEWLNLTAPAFDAGRAVLLDDRWASAREDVARVATGQLSDAAVTGAGPIVAAQARWLGLDDLATQAEDTTRGVWADEVAVVTGASKGSIASAIVEDLLAGGATVVATTSNLDGKRLAWFKELYRTHARVGASLWVVPANLASYADVDALVAWVTSEQTRRLGPTTEVVKPALHPTLLFPFAAGPVMGDLAEAGGKAELQARILLWSVERLVGADWGRNRVHVVLPGSPNRGIFGGDGAYGEAKAALDAMVAKWSSESGWPERVTLAHAIIGWVAGTGLMGANDAMVTAVRNAGVKVWTPDTMAAELLALCTTAARESAAERPLHLDLAEGLENVNLRDVAAEAQKAMAAAAAEEVEVAETVTIDALPSSPAQLPAYSSIDLADVPAAPEDLVVIVGAGELGPWGSSRTRHQVEVGDGLSAAGVLELAWSTGLVRWDAQGSSWYDVESGDAVAEQEIRDRYHDTVVERAGIRTYGDDGTMVDNTAPLMAQVFLDQDLTFRVESEAEARAFVAANPAQTTAAPTADGGWLVTRKAGTEVRVPRRVEITRTAGGQIPTGFDPGVWGIPAEMLESVDRVALWNLVCTVDAFLSSGFTPAELMRWVHPARVANTQGTGLGGMTSMQSLYIDNLLGESVANDLLQEALPNVIAAHVVQSYVGSYGAMIHPVAACATTAVSIEEGVDKIKVGKADVVVAGGFDDLGTEGIVGFAAMSATADTQAMLDQGIDIRHISRPNDRRRGGFVESQGGGTILLARGDVAARMGLPVLGVVAYAASFADGIHTSIPAPGIGALAAGLGRKESPLAKALGELGLGADDVGLVSKHDTSTNANDPNESDLHERLAAALGRSEGNPLYVVSQKSLTGHAKGGAAAFQVIGLCQVLREGVLPPNRALDCVDPELAKHPHLVWPRSPLATGPLKAGLVTSLGFGHVAGLLAIAHPDVFIASLPADERAAYVASARRRETEGALTTTRVMLGEPGFVKTTDRRLGDGAAGERKENEAALLLDPNARLAADGRFECR